MSFSRNIISRPITFHLVISHLVYLVDRFAIVFTQHYVEHLRV